MAKPTSTFEWATDANHNDPGEGWDGQPTRVAPSAGAQQAGFLPNTPITAETLNFLLGVTGDWITYLEERPETNCTILPASVLIPGGGWEIAASGSKHIVSNANNGQATLDLSPYIAQDATLLYVDLFVTPGAARASLSDRVRAYITRRTVDWAAATDSDSSISISFYDDGTASAQVIEAAVTTPAPADRLSEAYSLIIEAGSTGASAIDRIDALRIRTT